MATCKEFDTGSDQITQLCNFCDSNVSDGFCGDCEDHMCQSCFDIHTKAKACRHHLLLDSKGHKENKKTHTETCKLHPSMIVKFYCVAHKIVGCVECFFPEHRNCNYQNIDDAAKLFHDSGEDTRLKKKIHRIENTHSEYTRQLEEDKETVAVINNTVVNDVKSFTDSVTAYVAQVEKHVLEKSESLHVENETRQERRFNDLDSVGTEIEKCKMQLEDEDRVNRLFISAIEIGPVIEKLRKKIASIGRQHVVTKYEFQPNKLIMEMVNGSGSFGDVCILPGECFNTDLEKDDDPDASPTESVSRQLDDNISPKVTVNDCQKEIKNRTEKKNGDVPAEIHLKGSPIAKKKASFQLKRFTGRKFCLIKSDACSKPLRYNPQSEEVYIDEEDNLMYDGDRCFAIIVEKGEIKLDQIVDVETTNTTPVKTTSGQDHSAAVDNLKQHDSPKATSQDDFIESCARDCDDVSTTNASSSTSKMRSDDAIRVLAGTLSTMNLDQQADSKDAPNQHTGNKIFSLSDAECNRNLKIHVRTSLSKQSGKDACYTFGCKTMDVYLRWNMALRETSIFKQVVKKLPIAKKYQLKIASPNAALLIEAPSFATNTEEEALRVASDVVDVIVEDTKVYSCECINLEGDDSVEVLTEIQQSRLSCEGQLVEACDDIENKLWVLCHPKVKDHVMDLVEKARQASKMKSNQGSETLILTFFLHQRMNDQQVKYDFEQTFSSVELTRKKILNADTVLVTLRSETAKALKAAKMWIYDLEHKFASCAVKYSDHEGRVSGDLMTEFLNTSFKYKDIKHETNEEFHKVWIWSSSLNQLNLDKLTMKARNIIKNNKVFNSVTLPIGNIGLKKAFEKQRKKYDKFVEIECKENEVVISGLCYLVDTIQRELEIDIGSSKTGQNQPGSTPITNITAGEKHTDMSEDKSLEPCVICMDTVTDPKTIQCGHTFCTECIDQQLTYQKKCPTCGKHCGVITGDQPDGNMTDHVYQYKHLSGFENYGTIYITYNFPRGKQQSCHPSPGCSYKGITQTAYLPDNSEGRKILKMLRIAFDRKLTFTIGNSRTTGQEGVITWNDIHHKTDHRSHTQFGYPDPTYLERVKDELAAKGVTEEDI